MPNSRAGNDDFIAYDRAFTIVGIQEEASALQSIMSGSALHAVEPLDGIVDLLASLYNLSANFPV